LPKNQEINVSKLMTAVHNLLLNDGILKMPIPTQGGKTMENEETGVMVLDEGIEESAENMEACCSASVAKARAA
jgi:hypothetical protein